MAPSGAACNCDSSIFDEAEVKGMAKRDKQENFPSIDVETGRIMREPRSWGCEKGQVDLYYQRSPRFVTALDFLAYPSSTIRFRAFPWDLANGFSIASLMNWLTGL